ncbi:MAG: GNAT family N-acetyltransferase [Rhizomicrobium sp.]|nr:GNAT family N-acetyltransferase [Rhizomicrobium sp.]
MDAIYDHSREAHWPVLAPSLTAVFSSRLSASDARDYDAFVATARGSHYSQAAAWAPVVASSRPLTPYYFMLRSNGRVIGAAMVLRGKLGALPLPIGRVERGPVCDRREDLPEILKALKLSAMHHGIARLSVMPYWSNSSIADVDKSLGLCGFSDVQTITGSHVRALRLDLSTVGPDDSFGGSDFTKLRKELRRAERAGAIARRGCDADLVAYRGMLETRQHADGKSCPPAAYYEALKGYFLSGDARNAMFVADYEGEAVSAVFATRFGDMTYFVAGASSGRGLVFSKMVQPMAAAVLWARQQGSKEFDFGGMPMAGDSDPKRNSIALFKRSFSRTEVDLVHEHVRWF